MDDAAARAHELRAAGFDYLYYDDVYADKLVYTGRSPLEDPCGVLVKEYLGPLHQYRRLVDVRGCE